MGEHPRGAPCLESQSLAYPKSRALMIQDGRLEGQEETGINERGDKRGQGSAAFARAAARHLGEGGPV
jgi:hypothetical protein